MERILITGLETAVGANFSVGLACWHPVVGVTFRPDVVITGVETELSRPTAGVETLRRLIQRVEPQRVIYCGVGAFSAWEESALATDKDIAQTESWLAALDGCEAQFTLISSDAVFTGPWMFHAENSHSHCPSPEALRLRVIEQAVMDRRPESLILRTHAFGWTPNGTGWLEQTLAQLHRGQEPRLDCFRHASPILAADLLEVLLKAWQSGLAGTYHVAGAERVNPVQFVSKLAHEFGLFYEPKSMVESLVDRTSGFAKGETSLQTRKIRRALGIGLPLVSEGMQRLARQSADGLRERLQPQPTTPRAKVA